MDVFYPTDVQTASGIHIENMTTTSLHTFGRYLKHSQNDKVYRIIVPLTCFISQENSYSVALMRLFIMPTGYLNV